MGLIKGQYVLCTLHIFKVEAKSSFQRAKYILECLKFKSASSAQVCIQADLSNVQ